MVGTLLGMALETLHVHVMILVRDNQRTNGHEINKR